MASTRIRLLEILSFSRVLRILKQVATDFFLTALKPPSTYFHILVYQRLYQEHFDMILIKIHQIVGNGTPILL